jgi:peptidoglycan hydrolase-like protein with peptidoglycan-binding domain
MTIPLTELDRLWTKQAVFLWRDFESLSEAMGDPRADAWIVAELGRQGYSGDKVKPIVADFQRDSELQPDGILGTRTLMAIYSRASYPRPRLTGGAS